MALTIYNIYLYIMAIVTHTFLDKTNSIVEGEKINLGLNPILELYYGLPVSRGLIHFDITNLINKVEDKTYPDMDKLHHRLKMKNVGGLKNSYQSKFNKYNDAERAKSFDLVFFEIDRDWDAGGGYDYHKDGYDAVNIIYSTHGSNWFQCKDYENWEDNGVFDREYISEHYLTIQHFDVGNEDIDIDITDYVNDCINGDKTNFGLGVAFSHDLNEVETENLNYVGFFTDHTHTFFHPYVETRYDDYINDDRTNFYLDKDNRLYFYANVGGKMVNLDEVPTCTVLEAERAVKQATKGVYYIELNMASEEYEPETMFYDVWSNLRYNGRVLPDVELYFTTKAPDQYFTFGLPYETKKQEKIVPSISGINHREQIEQGDVRKIKIDCKIAYTTKQQYGVDGLEYRLYGKASDIECDVISWTPVERGYNENFFLVDTKELAPGKYFIDIKVLKDMEEIYHNELCEFDILNNKKDLRG